MKTKILITGCCGYVGNAMVLDLLKRKKEFDVRVTSRIGKMVDHPEISCFCCEPFEERPNLREALEGVDVVVHASALEKANHGTPVEISTLQRIFVLGSVYLAQAAAQAGVKRFVFLSTIEVDGEVTPPGKKFYADSVPRPKLALGKTMLAAEREVRKIAEESKMELVIVRCPMVYGPECSNLFRVVQLMVQFCLPLPLGSTGDNERSLVSIDNLVDFLRCVSVHEKAANEVFLVSDGQDLSTLQIFKLLARTGHRPCMLWPFPKKLLSLFNSYIGRRTWGEFFFESRVEDITKNRLLLNWIPPISVEEGFARSWYKKEKLSVRKEEG
ncbi:NAD-dependent epimerase/dehydratase family protein [Turicimonas muris]